MITLYKPNETDFTHNGIGILDANIYDPVVEETLNGLFIFSFRYPLFAPHGAEIEGQCIIKAPTPDGEQLFRVARPQPSMGELKVLCYHIFYDLTDNLIEDTFIENKSGTAALDQLSTKCQYPHPFKFFSDISKVSSSRLVRKNPVEAILDTGQDNCFLNRWGGEVKRDNFNVHILVNRGKDRGVVIQHKKNLLGYEGDIDWQSPVTRIMPLGFNGLMLPEKYVDSPNINKYPRPKIRVVEFKDVKAQDDKNNDPNAVPLDKAYEMLRQFSKEMYSKQKVDQPKATYKVTFQELSQTEEYKDFAVLQRVYMGDTVTVQHGEDNIDIQAKVISYKYDPIIEEYISLTLGNYKESFTNIAGKIDQIQDDMSNMESSFLDTAKDIATNLINSGFGGHVRIYPERILIMDTENEKTAKRVWQWNINGLGYSKTGINGPYGLAMTMDGRIVADFMTTGTLDAYQVNVKNLRGESIIAGDITARNGTFRISLDRSAIDFYSVTEKIATTISQAKAADGVEITSWTIEALKNQKAALAFGKRNSDGTNNQALYIEGTQGNLYSYAPMFYCYAELNTMATTYFKKPVKFEGLDAVIQSTMAGTSWSITNDKGFKESVSFNPHRSGSGSIGQAKQVWGEGFFYDLHAAQLEGKSVKSLIEDAEYGRKRADGAWDYASANLGRINDLGGSLGSAWTDIRSLQTKTDGHDRAIQELRDALNRKADK
ncbi:TPA: phage tail protein [Bacillus pseudomycoides]|nr:phage tail protein [Bacillus pseudomycoides]